MDRFKKYEHNPILGGKDLGTCFDVYVTKDKGRYRMDFSWRPEKSVAVTFSDDGIHWETPQITLGVNTQSGWEDDINRNCVLKIGDKYKMWYTGQAKGLSAIGYAESDDGIHFKRVMDEPVLTRERDWEGFSVMNPCVLYENGIYKMWYAAGETFEPNVLAYAESKDGIHWDKYGTEPIYTNCLENSYEKDRVGGCQVLHTQDMGYVMFYIGYRDIHTANICMARSDNGIDNWERSAVNPIGVPTVNGWDHDSCYKPSALWIEEENTWKVWYNGRKGDDEAIGFIYKKGRKLF